MAFTKTQLMKQIHAAATLGILTPADLAGVFNDAPPAATKKKSPMATSSGAKALGQRAGKRTIPKNLRQAAIDATLEHDLLPQRRLVVSHTKNDADPYRLTLCDAETWRVVARNTGERVRTPRNVHSAAKRILKRAEKVDAN
jgi:hypothetical protein